MVEPRGPDLHTERAQAVDGGAPGSAHRLLVAAHPTSMQGSASPALASRFTPDRV
jgi:hypothetical protein